jgi:hypothetical protein
VRISANFSEKCEKAIKQWFYLTHERWIRSAQADNRRESLCLGVAQSERSNKGPPTIFGLRPLKVARRHKFLRPLRLEADPFRLIFSFGKLISLLDRDRIHHKIEKLKGYEFANKKNPGPFFARMWNAPADRSVHKLLARYFNPALTSYFGKAAENFGMKLVHGGQTSSGRSAKAL